MLSERVDDGDLPPLEERLPVESDRLVVETPEYGVFGGTFRSVVGGGDAQWLNRLIGYDPMLRADPTLAEFGLPGKLRDVERNEDATEFVLHLREGMRWSDGEPVSADDIMFAVEEVYFDEVLTPAVPDLLQVDGEPCTAEKVDDLTVRLTYPAPKGDFLAIASRLNQASNDLLNKPRHYLQDFLPSHNPDAEDLAEEEGYSDWASLFFDRISWYNNPDLPVLNPWVTVDPLNEGLAYVAERNPYYWKTDDDGAQLPFIDRLELEIVQEEEVMVLKALNGEVDFHSRGFNTDANRPVLAEGREDGDYEFVTVEQTSMNRAIISLNLNHQDEVLREVFQNKDFRIGLSHAINREEIIDTVYQRQGEPWQGAPRPESDYYDEEFAKQYTEYDVDLANEYLDAAGLTETDSDGFRLRPDGDRLRFQIDLTLTAPEWATALDMVTTDWAAVGVDAQVDTMERSLFWDRKEASSNQHDANVWGGDGGYRVEMNDMRWWFPFNANSFFAPRWQAYFTSQGESPDGEEPPPEVLEQMELAWQIPLEPEFEDQEEMFRRILEISKEQFYVIGLVLPSDSYAIKKNNLRNVADSFINAFPYLSPGHINPPTWYYED